MTDQFPQLRLITDEPLPALSGDYDETPAVSFCVELSGEWFEVFGGYLQKLCEIEEWEGSDADRLNSIAQMARIMECFVVGTCTNPVGAMIHFAGDEPPPNWLECDGTDVLQADWPLLYDAIGDTFGSAAENYFKLPDARGRVLVGAGAGAGLTERTPGDTWGDEDVNLSINQLPAHTHTIHSHVPLTAVGPGEVPVDTPGIGGATGSTGSGAAVDIMQPSLAVKVIIRGA